MELQHFAKIKCIIFYFAHTHDSAKIKMEKLQLGGFFALSLTFFILKITSKGCFVYCVLISLNQSRLISLSTLLKWN